MPPKPKFTREEIAAAALDLVSEQGMEALTARNLGMRLGSSARPVFTVFRSMEEVQQEVREAAMGRFESFMSGGPDDVPVFKRFGIQMVHFAVEEPKLYQLLFMTENEVARSFDDIFEELGDIAALSLEVIQADYQLDREKAWLLFRQIWVYTFGIGALCAARVCQFTEEEISQMLTQAFAGTMLLVKSGRGELPEGGDCLPD
ncbi:MAG: TetR/AcrR family transcriptional regulator [Candidatus Onthomonas sp.]